jgi:hypothetical protein
MEYHPVVLAASGNLRSKMESPTEADTVETPKLDVSTVSARARPKHSYKN